MINKANSISHIKWMWKNHIVVSPKYRVSSFMGYLKEKSSLMIFDKHANLKYFYGKRHLLVSLGLKVYWYESRFERKVSTYRHSFVHNIVQVKISLNYIVNIF
jgi:REP element-mobilizing transposase RayT